MRVSPASPAAAALLIAAAAAGCVPDAGRPDLEATAYLRILGAEDARPSAGPELELLIEATALDHDILRSVAVRALGRLENPAVAPHIVRLLDDPAPQVRAEAATALAQAHRRTQGDAALDPLLSRLGAEAHPEIRGLVARSLGQLRLGADDQTRVVAALVRASRRDLEDAPLPTLTGVALGLESVARRAGASALGVAARERLRELLFYDLITMRRAPDAARVRSLALSTLGRAGGLDVLLVEPTLRDPDPRVRAVAARFLSTAVPMARSELIRRSLVDPSMHVRLEVVRFLASEPRDALACTRLLAAAGQDVTAAVRVVALDALAVPCTDGDAQTRTLVGAASRLGPETDVDWQIPAHALVSLARLAPELATRLLPGFVSHRNPFVRSYAARAADALGDEATVRSLARDPDANVRSEAIEALARRFGHSVDDLLLEQLESDDPQLVRRASRLLEGSPRSAEVAEAALRAFERMSLARRETWRDARLALLERVAEGSAGLAPRLEPYLSDYDARVAESVALTLGAWTGGVRVATPEPLPRLPLPTAAELRALERTTLVLHMRRGGTIEIEPLPWIATTNAHRFVRLAREGYYDGLTLHRWAPNFVVQGGSPGANEYAGDGPFTRDEFGIVPHWRGTVGLSTRGRDTGDGQLFINLLDNVRLDHEYTVWGVVTDGMDVVDAVLEGDVIDRVEVRIEG